MKKNKFNSLFGRIGIALLISFIAFIIHSCRKELKMTDQQVKNELAGQNFPINVAKDWFGSSKALLSNKIKVNSDASFLNRISDFEPEWDKARTAVDTNFYVVEAPAKYASAIGFATDSTKNNINGITRLLILKNKKTGSLHAVLMQIHGDKGVNTADVHYMDVPQAFSGNIFYTSLQGYFFNGYIYKNGKIALVSSGNSSVKKSGPQVLQVYVPGYCVETTTDWYDVTCWVEHNGDIERCEYEYMYTTVETYCVPGYNLPGGGGGGVTLPDCPPGGGNNPPAQVYSTNGKKYVQVAAPGDGGDNPCTPQPPQEPVVDIDNKVKNECLHAMVDKVTNKNLTTVINGLIHNVFAKNNQLNLKYIDGTSLPAGVKGYAPHPTGANLGPNESLTLVVELNDNELPGHSQEFMTTVIMHESIHAYLHSIGMDDALQHGSIANIFATQMALDLQQMYPNLSPEDALNLAWGGLQTTDGFQTAIGSDIAKRGKFDATQLAYSVGSKGTRCNAN